MSLGKGGGTTVQTADLTPEQKAMIKQQVDFFSSTIAPAYKQTVGAAQDLYKSGAGGVTTAAQNLAGMAGQAQTALGSTGESALRTGISGLESLFSPQYAQQQLEAALVPAQQQYAANLAGQQATFGGAGQLGSARSALAQTALAGQTQAAQQQAAAKVMSDIAAQRAQAATTLANLGQGGIGQALGAASQGITAAMTPQDFYNRYASIIFGTPSTSYSPNFAGTQGFTRDEQSYKIGLNPFKPGGV